MRMMEFYMDMENFRKRKLGFKKVGKGNFERKERVETKNGRKMKRKVDCDENLKKERVGL